MYNYRIIDANVNRASEGLRVLEEICRFILNDILLNKNLKDIRHKICNISDKLYPDLLLQRNSLNDVGLKVENTSLRINIESIFKANIKRVEEALRVLEEYLPNYKSKFECFRYKMYDIEKNIWEKLIVDIKRKLLDNRNLYLVTSNIDTFSCDNDYLDAIGSALKGGVNIVQLREKKANTRKIIEIGKKIRELTSYYNALFIVNDRIDIANIVEADGVHLGQDDIPIEEARLMLNENKIIGISTHKINDAIEAVEKGANYIGVGPIFETPTKLGRKACGFEYLNWVKDNIQIPYFAIGGINENNIKEVIKNGANRIAVVRAIMNCERPEDMAKTFLKLLE